MAKKKLTSGAYIVFHKETKEPIGINWVFDSEDENGNQLMDYRTKEELGEEFFINMCDEIRADQALDAKEKYKAPTSLDDLEYEGEAFADYCTPVYYLNLEEEKAEEVEKAIICDEFINVLTPVQQRRLQYRLDDPNISLREISRREGVGISKICKTFEQIKKKYLVFAS